MATMGDWLTGNFDLFGTTVQNWMVAIPSIIAVSIKIACWKR
jgi:hypothetical protein